jgi:hypothetical protein
MQRRETKWKAGGRLQVQGDEMASRSGSQGARLYSKKSNKAPLFAPKYKPDRLAEEVAGHVIVMK